MAIEIPAHTVGVQPAFMLAPTAQAQATNAVAPVAAATTSAPDLRKALGRVESALAGCAASCANRGKRLTEADALKPTLWSIGANWVSFGIIGAGAAATLQGEGAIFFGLLGPAAVTLGRYLEPVFYRTCLQDRQALARPLEQLAVPQAPLEVALVGTIADRTLARMSERKITGFAAGQLLREAAARGRGVDDETRALADKLLTIFDCFLDERGKPTGTLTEAQALEAAFAYEALPPSLRAEARALLDERLLAAKGAPAMSGQAWNLLYQTTREKTPAVTTERGGEQ